MKNVSCHKNWNLGALQMHVEPPTVLWIKSKNDIKLDKGCEKIKLCMDPTSEQSDIYEFKMALFDNGYP